MSDTNNTTIRFGVDASGVQSGVNTIKTEMPKAGAAFLDAGKKAEVMAKAITEAANNNVKATERQVNSLIGRITQYTATVGKSRADLLAQQAAQMGMSESLGPLIAKMREADAALQSVGHSSRGVRTEMMRIGFDAARGDYGRLAGSAMELGEQFDIMGKLAAMGGGATVGALAAVAASVAAVVVGIEAANSRFEAFNAAMNGTMGYARQTRESVQGLAEDLSQRFGVGVGAATDQLNQLVATGKVTADLFPTVGSVAVAMTKTTGESFDKVLGGLLKQQDEVKKAAEEYQAAHHSMTDAQMALIDSLDKTGRKHEAFKLLITQELDDIERTTKEKTGTMASMWDGLTAGVQRYFRALAGKSTDIDVLNDLKEKQAAQQSGRMPGDYTDYGPLIAAQQKTVDGNKADQAQADRNAAKNALLAESLENVRKEYERTLGPQQKLAEATKRDNAIIDERIRILSQTGKLTPARRAQLEALRTQMIDFDTKHDMPKHARSPVSGINADASSALQLRKLAEQQAQQQLQFQRSMGLVSAEDYYRKLHDIEAKALQDEIDTEQKRVNALSKFQGSAAYKEAAGKLALLRQQLSGLDQTRDNSIAEDSQSSRLGMQQFQYGLDDGVSKQRAGFDQQDQTQFMPQQLKAETEQRLQILQQFYDKETALRQQYALDPQSKRQELQDKLQRLAQAQTTELNALNLHLQQQQEIRDSYSDQMNLAMVKLSGDGQTAAQTTADAFTQAWSDSTNALNTFLTTGKGNFDQFVSGVLADMAKIALQFAEMQAMKGLMGALFGGGSSMSSLFGLSSGTDEGVASSVSGVGSNSFGFTAPLSGFATGGHITGPGTGTSDSIPAMLSNGEYVINAAATKKYRGVLDSINSGRLSHFASGGAVGSVQSSSVSSDSSGSSNPVSVVVNHNSGGGLSDQDAKDLHKLVQAFVDQRMSYQMRRQGGYAQQIRYGQI